MFAYKQKWYVLFLVLRTQYGKILLHAEPQTLPSTKVYISDLQPALNINMPQVHYWIHLNSIYTYAEVVYHERVTDYWS